MSVEPEGDRVDDASATRRAQAVRLIVTRRERAPRSPKMERAFKRLIWRYLSSPASEAEGGETSSPRASEGEEDGIGGEGGC